MSRYLFLIVCCFIWRCSNNDTSLKKGNLRNTDVDTIIDFSEKVHKYQRAELNLTDLSMSNDTFELRLWVVNSKFTNNKVFIIKKINNKWTCLQYSYWEKLREFNGEKPLVQIYGEIDSMKVSKIQPISGWDTFLKEIEKEKIYELPSQSEIQGFKDNIIDGISYRVEFRRLNKYDNYIYSCPKYFANQYWQCKQMEKIVEIFNKELMRGEIFDGGC